MITCILGRTASTWLTLTAVTVGPNWPPSVRPGRKNKLPKLCFLNFFPRVSPAKGHRINLVNFLPHCRTVNKGQAAVGSSRQHLSPVQPRGCRQGRSLRAVWWAAGWSRLSGPQSRCVNETVCHRRRSGRVLSLVFCPSRIYRTTPMDCGQMSLLGFQAPHVLDLTFTVLLPVVVLPRIEKSLNDAWLGYQQEAQRFNQQSLQGLTCETNSGVLGNIPTERPWPRHQCHLYFFVFAPSPQICFVLFHLQQLCS